MNRGNNDAEQSQVLPNLGCAALLGGSMIIAGLLVGWDPSLIVVGPVLLFGAMQILIPIAFAIQEAWEMARGRRRLADLTFLPIVLFFATCAIAMWLVFRFAPQTGPIFVDDVCPPGLTRALGSC